MTTLKISSSDRSFRLRQLIFIFAVAAVLVAFAQTGRAQHTHDTNLLAVYINPPTSSSNFVQIHFFAQPNKTTILQYKPLAATNLLTQPWINFPNNQAPNLPGGIDWSIKDYSVTNRAATNRGRIYRLRFS